MSKKGCTWLNNGHQLMAKKSTHVIHVSKILQANQ